MEAHRQLAGIRARGSEADRFRGLGLGAVDYLVKPFSTGELSVRLEGHLRQTRRPPETVLRAAA